MYIILHLHNIFMYDFQDEVFHSRQKSSSGCIYSQEYMQVIIHELLYYTKYIILNTILYNLCFLFYHK